MDRTDISFEDWLASEYVPIAGGETAPAPEAPPAGEPGDGGDQPPDGGEAQPSADQLTERMDQVLSRFDEFERRQVAAAEQIQPEPGPDPLGGDPQPPQPAAPDPETDPEGFVRSLIAEEARNQAREMVREEVGPIFEQQDQARRERETEQLVEDYPEFQDPNTSREVVAEAQQWAADLNAPALAREPGFLELVLLAAKTAERGASETPAGGAQEGEVQLEGAGAATPTPGPQTSADRAEAIKNAGTKRGFWA